MHPGTVDLSADSIDNPRVYIKAEVAAEGKVLHMKECSVGINYEDENGNPVSSEYQEFQVIHDGCVQAISGIPGADQIQAFVEKYFSTYFIVFFLKI
mgnify:CR=1 FL=1